jgi:transcriptional regulator with XRE-family HTH domain
MEFMDRLKMGLKGKGLTQTKLAEILNIRRPLISEWGSNHSYPYADVAVEIAKIIGTTVEELITGEPPKGISEEAMKLAHDYELLDDAGKQSIEASMEGLKLAHPKDRPKKAVGQS